MEKLKKILLLSSLVGILLLLFISQQITPRNQNISDINESQLEQRVKIIGNIIEVREYSNNTFHILKIQDLTGSISVIFNTKPQALSINYSREYSVIGKLEKYNQTLQVAAEKITLMPSS